MNMICRFLTETDESGNSVDISVKDNNGYGVVEFNYEDRILVQIAIPKESMMESYTIYAFPRFAISQEQILNAAFVLNAFNKWATGINSGIFENKGTIWFKCNRFSQEEISEEDFEADFKRVLNYCWFNMPKIMDKIKNGVTRIIDFSE